LMMSLWDALRMNMMISYQELVRTFLQPRYYRGFSIYRQRNVSTGLTGRTLATQPGKRTLSATHDIQNLSSI
ncbi:hypothetical protein, partial [Klebsiella pneumoniae]|uniref:hypothetical protein n=1 Tax=Klebsiella pneumoniae TaxID=573 RepID=UPI00406AB234